MDIVGKMQKAGQAQERATRNFYSTTPNTPQLAAGMKAREPFVALAE